MRKNMPARTRRRRIVGHARSILSVNNPSRERGKKLLSLGASQPRRLRRRDGEARREIKRERERERNEERERERERESERERERGLEGTDGDRERCDPRSSSDVRTSRATIRKNLLIGDPDLYRAPGSYPRGSSSGAVYLDAVDPQPLPSFLLSLLPPSPAGHRRRDRQRKRNAPGGAFLGSLPIGFVPRIRVISDDDDPSASRTRATEGGRATRTRADSCHRFFSRD